MKILIFSILISVAGCTTVPVTQKFPKVPDSWLDPCLDLKETPVGTKSLTDNLIIIEENYFRANQCIEKTNTWIDWYKQQSKIFNDSFD